MADKRLASGNIASTSLTPIYTAAANGPVRVYSIIFTNTTSSTIDVDVSLSDGTTRLVKSITIPSGSGRSYAFNEIQTLSGGDIIYAQAGSASSFNYLINGRD